MAGKQAGWEITLPAETRKAMAKRKQRKLLRSRKYFLIKFMGNFLKAQIFHSMFT